VKKPIEIIPHKISSKGIVFNVRVVPRSSRACVVGVVGGALKVKLTAPPVEGAANRQLIEVLSDHFGVRKSDIEILKGLSGKNKIVEISTSTFGK